MMLTYRIIINGQQTDDFVTGETYIDAYFAASNLVPPAYKKDFKLERTESE